jgi:hypothetical protein
MNSGRSRAETKAVNGVRFSVTRTELGNDVRSDCRCMGSTFCATHTNQRCPLLKRPFLL